MGPFSLAFAWDFYYGLLLCSFPSWATSILRISWFGPGMTGWRWEVGYWLFVARNLAYLLPEAYVSDVELLIPEYKHAYPSFELFINSISGAVVYFFLWPKGCPWYDALRMVTILNSFVGYVHLACLNYKSLQKSGKTVRQNSWPYKDMYTKQPSAAEWIRWHATGSMRPRN
ncbi:hypothetical protein P153DRAFT_303584 [Dothidotthia symphoricarpi CBS 119687]|uniref:Uncharacterized protein n=1 Tax=Dothidotthia symphoricarpi CBS 119687 TaxID=1392245 RepID=A0A6A5ZZ48_9PLEO|nr:uncharacterized protein P153DRAFT_303584 [Dothidotthia symphoricarpi CBS 119687]KAF2123688.1 hypothetical protein P153DRAFT_303584 [Dothidotthia symphoricarpi CBS 119687]